MDRWKTIYAQLRRHLCEVFRQLAAQKESRIEEGHLKIYLVAPDEREREVVAQLRRPSVLATNTGAAAYILFSELEKNCDAMCRFGTGREILEKIVRTA